MTELENELVKFQIIDGILFSEFKDRIDIDNEVAQKLIELRHQISNNKKQYWCFDFNGVKSYTQEAHNYAGMHGQELLHACATVVDPKMNEFIANFFMVLKLPRVPMRVFADKKEAVNWLHELKRKNEEKHVWSPLKKY